MELPETRDQRDEEYWPYSKSGDFTTKSGYALLLQQQTEIRGMTSSMDTNFFRIIWGLSIMPKWKLFLWKLWHNGLATNHNLYNCQIGNSSNCPTCLDDIEDTQHLFGWCPLASEIWDRVSLGSQVNTGSHLPFH